MDDVRCIKFFCKKCGKEIFQDIKYSWESLAGIASKCVCADCTVKSIKNV
jgi:hypothetical protein